MRAAWTAGVRYFDTAPLYGHGLSEQRIGAALHLQPRDTFVLSTPRISRSTRWSGRRTCRTSAGCWSGTPIFVWWSTTGLARDTRAWVKLLGLVTEDGPGWSVERLRPYVDHLLERFGPARLIFGSDWPVVTLRASYAEWVAAVEALLAGLAPDARDRVLGLNSITCYRPRGGEVSAARPRREQSTPRRRRAATAG